MMNRILRSISLLLLCWALTPACTPSSPEDARLVIDDSLLLDADQRDRVALFHRLLLEDYDIDYRVVTSGETGDIDRYAVSRFAALGAGDSSGTERGLLLVIDPVQDRVRLEVGYALEGTFPDAFIAYVEQRQMVPFFKAGRVADGILATTELIVSRAQAASVNAGLDSEIQLEGSGGAGATTAARLGDGQDEVYTDDKVSAGRSPAETLEKYFAAMQQRNANPELDIYTPDTRRVLTDWVTTPAQMDNIVSSYRRCHAETERYDSARRYAVIRYPIAERQCSPWFFENIDGKWALDLTMMQRAIRFGRDNSWHFQRGAEHPYRFAFADWAFDSMGFPRDK
jgi:uncharacterized protein